MRFASSSLVAHASEPILKATMNTINAYALHWYAIVSFTRDCRFVIQTEKFRKIKNKMGKEKKRGV